MADLGSTKVFGDLTVAGDIRIGGASGNMTAPDFIQSSAQSTNAAACTRKDYVDSAIAAGDALQVSKSGDTMTGNLTAPKVLVSGAQGTEVNALTRKDYVDSAIAAGDALQVSKSGDIMTGALRTPFVYIPRDGADKALFGTGASDIFINNIVADKYLQLKDDGTLQYSNQKVYHQGFKPTAAEVGAFPITGGTITGDYQYKPGSDKYGFQYTAGTGDAAITGVAPNGVQDFSSSLVYGPTGKWMVNAQGTDAKSIARKDYVDGQVATRAPTAHTHTVAAITDLRPQDANATANTLVLRDGSADVNARLLRATYSDESAMSGAIAFRVNNSTNNYTRYCNNPESVRNWMKGAKTDWQMGWRAYIEHADNPMTEYHIPGKTAVITYLTGDGNYRITSSNGAGGAVADRLRIDSSGNLFTQAAIHEAGQRVYSPNNPPPKFAYQFQGERWVGDSIPLTNGAEIVLTEDVRGRMGRSQILDNGMNVQVMMQFPVIDSIFSVAQGNDHTVFELYGYGRRLKRLRGWGEGGPWQGFWVFT